MNEAALLIYAVTAIVAASLGWHGFRNRFLPIARPFTALAYLMFIFACWRFVQQTGLEPGQRLNQALLDADLLLASLVYPLWIWLLLEYHQEKKVPITNKLVLLFFIHPLLQAITIVLDIANNGFVSQISPTALINSEDRLGDYVPIRYVYAWSMLILLVSITPYLMIKKHHHTIWEMMKVSALTPMPFIAYALHQYGMINLHLSVCFLTIYLYWVSRQYRLLDVMPLALRGVIDNVNSGILVGDTQSKMLYVNDYADDLLGLNSSALKLNRRQQDIPELLDQNFDFTSVEKQEAQLEIQNQEDDGEKRFVDAMLQPILHPKSKKHLGATVSLHDVTERKKAELALQSVDRQKSDFFAGISHEFRTPLTLSLGNIDDILAEFRDLPDKDLEAALLRVKGNNQRLLKLVNQLLELSRLNAGSMQIQPMALHLETYLPPLIANFESQASKQNCRIRLQFNHQTAKQSTVYFDLDSFDKIIINLISNALKSMPDGGDITIRLDSADEEYLILSVSDSGCGITQNALPKVFEMFYSHENNNTAWPQGAGVGLSLVKQLLDQHAAEIDVQSIEGQGSTFTLRLRKGYEHFPPEVLVEHQTVPSNSKRSVERVAGFEQEIYAVAGNRSETIGADNVRSHEQSEKLVLLVDDNAEMRAYIRKHLAMHFRLIEAGDGEEALAVALQNTPDLVLSDVMMPRMNGYDLCRQLKSSQQTSHIPVLLLTAKSARSEKLEGLELGADDYLSKPFDIQELTYRINNLIASRQAIRELYQSNGLQKVICNPELPKRETSFLDTLQNYVEKNISNTDLKVSDMANVVHMSERSLSRKLKALTGDTPKKMILLIRLEYAEKLLLNTDDSITQISYQSGFSDASHFTRSFKSHYSTTPTEYRRLKSE